MVTRMHIERKPYFWIWSVIMPNLMLSVIGLEVFLISPDGNSDFFSDRASLLVTVILTSIAFQFTVSAALPILPYLTRLDRWRNGLNGLFLLSALECAYLQMKMNEYTLTEDGNVTQPQYVSPLLTVSHTLT